jgi:hypothetical protein
MSFVGLIAAQKFESLVLLDEGALNRADGRQPAWLLGEPAWIDAALVGVSRLRSSQMILGRHGLPAQFQL